MSAHPRPHRSSTRPLLAAVAFLLVAGLLSAGPVVAHTFTRNDGNDSPGKLDLRSVSVSHTPTGVVHKVRTYGTWTARSLGNDSFFIIQIDKNKDRNYERCAFIFYTTRLRGSLTNCGSQFIQFLPVAKPSGTVAKITIPKSQTGSVYWWAVASRWDGPAPCGRGCVDFAPNNFPDVLHDMAPPVVNMVTTPLRVWEGSATPNFTFPFSVSDAHSGIQSWIVQRQAVGTASWTFVAQGTSAGAKSPDIIGAEGTRFDYRVVAKDKQGNQTISPSRRVYIPTDDDTLAAGFSVAPTTATDATAFGGTYSEMSSGTFTYSWTPGTDCLFEIVGPGTGPWEVTVTAGAGTPATLDADSFPDQPRQTLYSDSSCATTYIVTWVSGTFGLDAILG
ncbi:MAG TPA: hypothetical protein VNP90_09460 [Actinomycetota bacterium]|nr:hypothetical protein [Actinomycetota bacterium]